MNCALALGLRMIKLVLDHVPVLIHRAEPDEIQNRPANAGPNFLISFRLECAEDGPPDV